MAANGAQYGVATVNYYWIGAIPAMVFLGLVMMPFYYGSKVRSVPEYLRLRFNDAVAQVQLVDVRARDGPDRRREPVRARARAEAPARAGRSSSASSSPAVIVAVYITPRRPLVGDLQRGAAVLRDPRGADPDRDRRAVRRRRLERPAGQVQADQRRRGRACTRCKGTVARQRDQPDRRRRWIGLVFGLGFVLVVRLLDDELRRGPARAVGEGPVGRPAHAADRRDPEARSCRSS